MIVAKQLTNEEIRKFAGHEDFATTERYYEFATKSLGEWNETFEALGKSCISQLSREAWCLLLVFVFSHILLYKKDSI